MPLSRIRLTVTGRRGTALRRILMSNACGLDGLNVMEGEGSTLRVKHTEGEANY